MSSTRRLASFVFITFFFVAAVGVAHGFDADQRKCRGAIGKNTLKLAKIVNKTLVKCHKDRSKNGTAVDCSTVSASSDPKSKVATTASKVTDQIGGAKDKCAGVAAPSAVGFTDCPAPCDAAVPSISSFADVANCLICLAKDSAEGLTAATQGAPVVPLLTAESKCHGTIGKQGGKYYTTVIKELVKCQKDAEKNGAQDTSSCEGTDPNGKIGAAETKVSGKISSLCTGATLASLDSCSDVDVPSLVACVIGDADAGGNDLFITMFGGSVTTTTTTTTSTTTTTTLPQDALCPNRAVVSLVAGVTDTACANNGDCAVGTCDVGLGRCVTATEEDIGWTGILHNSDTNEGNGYELTLACAGPPAPGCGQCIVTGLDPALGNCRCANDNRIPCDQPLVADYAHCGGSVCNCYLSPPRAAAPLGAIFGCVLDKFDAKPTGTFDVDTGELALDLNMRRVAYVGITNFVTCPVCGGSCTAGLASTIACVLDSDCDTSEGAGDGSCGNFDPVAGDGLRGGRCFGGGTSLNENDTCDVQAVNTSFPAYPGQNGGGYSLDCFPAEGKNVSGLGLREDISLTTGSTSMSANVDCGLPASYPPSNPHNCFCRVCSGDTTIACNSNADCSMVGAGTCSANTGSGASPYPNMCSAAIADGGDLFVGVCNDVGGGEGECLTATDDHHYCDGVVLANGEGYLWCNPTPRCEDTFAACTTNADCNPTFACVTDLDCRTTSVGLPAGDCTQTLRQRCFNDPIVATGTPDPQAPIGVATFCIPPTGAGAANLPVGLPGPARWKQTMTMQSLCASDPGVVYTPGASNCPPPPF